MFFEFEETKRNNNNFGIFELLSERKYGNHETMGNKTPQK